jgi:hypothetical protein
MVGGTQLVPTKANSCKEFLSDKQFAQIEELANQIPVFESIDQDFAYNAKGWSALLHSNDPISQTWPGLWQDKLNSF